MKNKWMTANKTEVSIQIESISESIDENFGEGFAKNNPNVLAKYIHYLVVKNMKDDFIYGLDQLDQRLIDLRQLQREIDTQLYRMSKLKREIEFLSYKDTEHLVEYFNDMKEIVNDN